MPDTKTITQSLMDLANKLAYALIIGMLLWAWKINERLLRLETIVENRTQAIEEIKGTVKDIYAILIEEARKGHNP